MRLFIRRPARKTRPTCTLPPCLIQHPLFCHRFHLVRVEMRVREADYIGFHVGPTCRSGNYIFVQIEVTIQISRIALTIGERECARVVGTTHEGRRLENKNIACDGKRGGIVETGKAERRHSGSTGLIDAHIESSTVRSVGGCELIPKTIFPRPGIRRCFTLDSWLIY